MFNYGAPPHVFLLKTPKIETELRSSVKYIFWVQVDRQNLQAEIVLAQLSVSSFIVF